MEDGLQPCGPRITRGLGPLTATVTLRPGHVQPVWAGHPWVYAQAVERVEGGAQAGDEVIVRDPRGNALGRGLYSPGSAIAVRIYTRDEKRAIDGGLILERIERAIGRRRAIGLPADDTDGYRLIHAEGDDLPGLIVDRYGEVLVIQVGTIGVKRRLGPILDGLTHVLSPRAILDRTSQRTAKSEGFAVENGVLYGDAALGELEFVERGLKFRIPLALGQKTGFYLDQRPLRGRIEALARGRRVLDAFSYVGAIALAAARGGAAEVIAADTSGPALETAAACAELNGLLKHVVFEHADAHEVLARAGRKGGYDLVICDPPKLAPTRAAKRRALDSMRRLAAAGCRATTPGGLLVLCSCSAAIGTEDLTRSVALGARDVGMRATVLERLFQGPDHPVAAAFPEGLYLSTLLLEVTAA